MANINVSVTDGNNIVLSLTPPNTQVITIDRGIAGPVGPAGPTTPPGGSNTQVQYNNAGAFAGSANLTFNGITLTTNTLGAFILGGTVSGGGNQINNVVIGASTPLAGSFTTLSASSLISGLNASGPQATFSGWNTLNGANSSRGEFRVGGSATFYGAFQYSDIGNTTLYIDNSYDNAGAAVVIRTRTLGTPTSIATFSATGLAVTGAISATGTTTTFGTASQSKILFGTTDTTHYIAAGNDYLGMDISSVGGGNTGIHFITGVSGSTETMRLDQLGNLGLGVTPSAWGSYYKAIEATTASSFAITAQVNDIEIGSGYYRVNSGFGSVFSITSGTRPSKYLQTSGIHQWFTSAGNGTAGAAITFTQAMTLDASSNLAVTGKVSAVSYTETVFAITGTTPALTPNNGSIQTWTLSGNSTPTAGTWASGQSMTVMIDDGTAFTVTWTSMPITWVGGSAPTLATTGYNIIELWKVNTVIYGAFVGSA